MLKDIWEKDTTYRHKKLLPSLAVSGNLAVSMIRKVGLPTYEIQNKDYGYRKFNKKVHIMEQNP